MTSFIEPIYGGEYAGYEIAFSSNKEPILAAAGIWNETILPSGKKAISFAILTDPAPKQVDESGHDRMIKLVDKKGWKDWLAVSDCGPSEMVDVLRAHALTPKFDVSIDRALAKGWEKRGEKKEKEKALRRRG